MKRDERLFDMMMGVTRMQQMLARGEDRAAVITVGDTREQIIRDVIRIEMERIGVSPGAADDAAVEAVRKLQIAQLI